jgi:hypothetical protein
VRPFAELCGHPFREADPGTQSGKVRSYAVGSPSIVWREARSSKKSAPPGGPIHASGKSGGPYSTFAFRPLAEFNPGRPGGCDGIEVLLNCGQSRLYYLGIQGLIPGAIAWTAEIDLTGLQVSVRNTSGLRIALEQREHPLSACGGEAVLAQRSSGSTVAIKAGSSYTRITRQTP